MRTHTLTHIHTLEGGSPVVVTIIRKIIVSSQHSSHHHHLITADTDEHTSVLWLSENNFPSPWLSAPTGATSQPQMNTTHIEATSKTGTQADETTIWLWSGAVDISPAFSPQIKEGNRPKQLSLYCSHSSECALEIDQYRLLLGRGRVSIVIQLELMRPQVMTIWTSLYLDADVHCKENSFSLSFCIKFHFTRCWFLSPGCSLYELNLISEAVLSRLPIHESLNSKIARRHLEG